MFQCDRGCMTDVKDASYCEPNNDTYWNTQQKGVDCNDHGAEVFVVRTDKTLVKDQPDFIITYSKSTYEIGKIILSHTSLIE